MAHKTLESEEDSIPEREKDTVAHHDSHSPQDGEAQADVLKIVVGARQQVPGGQLLGREPLGDLVLHDGLDALPAEVEDVAQGEVAPFLVPWPSMPQLPNLLLHRTVIPLDDSCMREVGWTTQHAF